MTVRASVEQHTWEHVDYRAALSSLVTVLRKLTPYAVAALLMAGAIMLAVSCKVSSIAFRNDSRVSTLKIEVADNPGALSRGLMGRESLPADSGMLFDFGREVDTTFWMKNTSIPLSIAFIGSNGRVLAINDMRPFDETPVTPPGNYRYAVEVNKGWFSSHGIKAGTVAVIDRAR